MATMQMEVKVERPTAYRTKMAPPQMFTATVLQTQQTKSVTLQRVTVSLTNLHAVYGTIFLLSTLVEHWMLFTYGQAFDIWPICYCYLIAVAIAVLYYKGKPVLKANNNKNDLRRLAFGFAVCFLALCFVDYVRDANILSRFRGMAKMVIANYDSQLAYIQRFIDENQQKFRCCGVTDYKDYHKRAADVPVSCCHGSPLDLLDRCPQEVLEHRMGCEAYQAEILSAYLSSPALLVDTIIWWAFVVHQMLLVIFVLILAKRV